MNNPDIQNKTSITIELLIVTILLAPVIYLLTVWSSLPDEIPLHWNFKGEIDGYGNKYTLWILILAISLPIYLLMLFLPKFTPKPENIEYMGTKYPRLRLILQLFLSSLFTSIIYASSGATTIRIETLLAISFAGFMILFGNYMGSIRQNHFMGIRTPWTLANEEVWRKTHQLGGKIWVVGGIVGLVLLFLLPENWALMTVVGLMVLPLIFTLIYSFILFKKLK